MRVGLFPVPRPERLELTTPLLDPAGPLVVLGAHDAFDGPLTPSATAMYGPRGAQRFGEDGPLWVADTGHHRLLGYRRTPTEDRTPADWVLGHRNFEREGRNSGYDQASAQTMNMPTGIQPYGDRGMIVADSWNNRVLIWRDRPEDSHVPADLVLGQANFEDQAPNRGREGPGPDTLHWPFQVLIHQGRLYVADAGNRRVLGWNQLPIENGQPADFVLGQPNLHHRSDNAGGPADARTLRWPHDLTIFAGNLAIADAGNNRVLIYDGAPTDPETPARWVLGQDHFQAVDHNRGENLPTAASLSMPYGLDARGDRLLVADTSNSRLLGYRGPLSNGAPAVALTGQEDFRLKGDNRWQLPVRDSLCWPYGLKLSGDLAIVADTGNHRVVLWRILEAPRG